MGQSGPYAPRAFDALVGLDSEVFEIVGLVEGAHRQARIAHAEIRPGSVDVVHPDSLWHRGAVRALPTLYTTDINGPQALEVIARYEPDWIVCAGFDRLFGQELLSIPKAQVLNAHPSDLPDFRGPSPIFWQLKAGLRSSVLTLHLIDVGEDTGPWLLKEPFDFVEMGTGEEIYSAIGHQAGSAFGEALLGLIGGTLRPQAQAQRKSFRARRPKDGDADLVPSDFELMHLARLIQGGWFFTDTALKLGDERWLVHKAWPVEDQDLPGSHVQRDKLVWVRCKDGVLCCELAPDEWLKLR